MSAVCGQCGGEDFHREVEVIADGSRDVTVKYDQSGALKVTEGHVEMDGGDRDYTDGDYVCSDCGATAHRIEDLVVPAGAKPGALCACGHGFNEHTPNRVWDRKLYTRPLKPCEHCHCRDFETDPALASVVAPELERKAA